MQLPSLKSIQAPSLSLNLGRRSGGDVVGLDIQPGLVAAVQASVNGSIRAKRAAVLPLAPDTVREGEVVDESMLTEALRELFGDTGLSRRVRIGVANQRTVLRTLDLPPVTDRKELAAVVRFQAQDQVPMPLNNAVLDFHPLGVVDTPAGPRQRVVLVAAQRDMVERLLAAVRAAGLRPEGIDLSAFALIRALYRPDDEHAGRVLYLNVDGLTNLAIAEGAICRFTRVVGGGMEAMAVELAERRGVPLTEARTLLSAVDLTQTATAESTSKPVEVRMHEDVDVAPPDVEAPTSVEASAAVDVPTAVSASTVAEGETPTEEVISQVAPVDASVEDQDAREVAMTFSEMSMTPAETASAVPQGPSDADVRLVLENGLREISGEVRNSLDFHRSQEGGGEVSAVVLSGSVLDIPGFADALQALLGVEVRTESVSLADESLAGSVATHRLAVATGLTAVEASQ
ncbi:MAG TPA: pilus assembly protein PilM [Solirubrobacteraceae bacterium]|jgi:type IV pilus assembly protein PilM